MYHKWKSHNVWLLRYGVQWTEFFVIFDCFLPFYPPNNLKNQHFAKRKRPPRDIIILNRCAINDNHMMYGSWDMEHDRLNFCPFTPLRNWKIKNFEKMKINHEDIIISYMCTINDNHMMYGSWDMEHDWQNVLSFWTIFCPSTPYEPEKSKFWKNENNAWKYYRFTHVHHKWQSYDVWFLIYQVWRTVLSYEQFYDDEQFYFCHFGQFFALLPP